MLAVSSPALAGWVVLLAAARAAIESRWAPQDGWVVLPCAAWFQGGQRVSGAFEGNCLNSGSWVPRAPLKDAWNPRACGRGCDSRVVVARRHSVKGGEERRCGRDATQGGAS